MISNVAIRSGARSPSTSATAGPPTMRRVVSDAGIRSQWKFMSRPEKASNTPDLRIVQIRSPVPSPLRSGAGLSSIGASSMPLGQASRSRAIRSVA